MGRLVIDGVMDSEDYYSGELTVSRCNKNDQHQNSSAQRSTSLLDADATLFGIYQACVEAGPLVCPIHESSVEKIRDRVQKLINSLRSNPATFYNADTGSYGEVDYSLVKKVIFSSLYMPYESSPRLVSAIADLERGSAEPIFRLSEAKAMGELITESCTCPSVSRVKSGRRGMENILAISCGDGNPVNDEVDTLKEYYNNLSQTSMFYDIWYPRLECSCVYFVMYCTVSDADDFYLNRGWKVRAKERFTGM